MLKNLIILQQTLRMSILNQHVVIDKDTAAGVPIFKGTRVAVKTLFDYLEDSALEEFLEGFPSVSRERAESVIEQAVARRKEDKGKI
jgi:uncharacterized protein (DUF433 family)